MGEHGVLMAAGLALVACAGPGGFGVGDDAAATALGPNGLPVIPDTGERLDQFKGADHVVDAAGVAGSSTIGEAVAAARPGDRILVLPGVYRESVELERPVAIVGDGPPGSVILEATGSNLVVSKAMRALIEGVTLRQLGGEPSRYGIDVARGHLTLRRCLVTSGSLAAIAVRRRAQLHVVASRVHDSAQSGIFVYDGGEAVVTGSDIVANTYAGIEIKDDGRASLRGNRFLDGGGSGVFVNGLHARATIDDNLFARNKLAAVEVKERAEATLRRNRFLDGTQSGVFVNSAFAVVERNVFRGNAFAGVEIKDASDAVVRGNTFDRGSQSGVFVLGGAKGVVERNTILRRGLAGVEVKGSGTTPIVRWNAVRESAKAGLYVHDGAGGLFEENQVTGNGGDGIEIGKGGEPAVRGNTFAGNTGHGVWVHDGGGGRFTDNVLRNNLSGPTKLDGSSAQEVTGDLPGTAAPPTLPPAI